MTLGLAVQLVGYAYKKKTLAAFGLHNSTDTYAQHWSCQSCCTMVSQLNVEAKQRSQYNMHIYTLHNV